MYAKLKAYKIVIFLVNKLKLIKVIFQSIIVYCWQESCKSIFNANKNIKSVSFSICLSMSQYDSFWPT